LEEGEVAGEETLGEETLGKETGDDRRSRGTTSCDMAIPQLKISASIHETPASSVDVFVASKPRCNNILPPRFTQVIDCKIEDS
jgi:hypothetical protein